MPIIAYMNPRTIPELMRRRDELLEYLVYTPRCEITERHAYQQQLHTIDRQLSDMMKRDTKQHPQWLRRLLLMTEQKET
jgi:hypothetical protein